MAVPTPDAARSWLRTLTEEPHVAGTEADHKTALFVRDKLREWGWQVEIAEYEVLLNYPFQNGITTISRLREQAPGLPIVMLTGFLDAQTIEQCTELGGVELLRKPFLFRELSKAVKVALKRG